VTDPVAFTAEIADSPFAAKIKWAGSKEKLSSRVSNTAVKLPTVFAHGMGDSCFNQGMQQITSDTGSHIGSYAVCVPTGMWP
jgi:hypothetical protein